MVARSSSVASRMFISGGEFCQCREKIREGFRYTGWILNLDARHHQADYRKCHRDTMVIVGLDARAVQPRRHYFHPVFEVGDTRAEAAQLRRDRAQTIALMMADKLDLADARGRG